MRNGFSLWTRNARRNRLETFVQKSIMQICGLRNKHKTIFIGAKYGALKTGTSDRTLVLRVKYVFSANKIYI